MTQPPVGATLTRLSLPDRAVERFETGSLPVYAIGDELVLKFYPAEDADEARIEATALDVLDGRLPVATPEPVAHGGVDDWHYLLMRRVPGRGLDEVWPSLSPAERLRLCERIGAVAAELHAVTDSRCAELGPADWAQFVAQRCEAVEAHHRSQELAPEWLARIPDFLDSVSLPASPTVLLHTELLREHVFVRRDGERWSVSGLIDFEPAMTGAREYEFVAASVYLAGGEAGLWRGFLRGYGLSADEEFARRCLAYTLLHRYSSLRTYLTWMPVPGTPSFDALARLWFGTSMHT
ncbi:aminoglycoside phosphotransferase family protein [Saccharomonospora piscinae]|uniref:phosphotransferase family protein n=1 Tax=Saccharomonospora piscinae TaxID=687388 RepID=UPI001105D8E9|nr:aminoglycoside 3'-phosphotransferase/choline kinase family protein [Saccharomonospora piscinae]TLW90704.1 aminoglycoside phosphotransferase family protein [Saccharomonospora piscinae]